MIFSWTENKNDVQVNPNTMDLSRVHSSLVIKQKCPMDSSELEVKYRGQECPMINPRGEEEEHGRR
jgi:hypothetical protein